MDGFYQVWFYDNFTNMTNQPTQHKNCLSQLLRLRSTYENYEHNINTHKVWNSYDTT